jgi:prepilin-type N-terminal cleavage/methylation domain-containing protein
MGRHTRRRGFTLIELLVVIAIIAILAAILFPVFATMKERAKRSACLANLRQIAVALQTYANDSDGRFPQANFDTPAQNPSHWSQYSYAFWAFALQPYCKSWNLFLCPSSPHRKPAWGTGIAPIATYGMNEYMARAESGFTQDNLPHPSETALVADCYGAALFHNWNDSNTYAEPEDIGGGIVLPSGMIRVKYANGLKADAITRWSRHEGANIIYADCHAGFMPLARFARTTSPVQERPLIYPKAEPFK